MQSEVDFLSFAGKVAGDYVPRLIKVDWERRCVILEHLAGKSYPNGSIPTKSEIEFACKFAGRLNSDREKAKKFIKLNAADGYTSLTEHLENVEQRVEAMGTRHLPESQRKQAENLINNIRLQLKILTDQTIDQIARGELSNTINSNSLCISPSDFGFHNAIRSRGSIKFIDFEFAGWDDPAKLISDFVLQPRIPVRQIPPLLIQAIQPDAAEAILRRCATLGPILRVKWLCIILSVLNPRRLKQLIAVHNDVDAETLTQQRILIATNYLNERTPFELH